MPAKPTPPGRLRQTVDEHLAELDRIGSPAQVLDQRQVERGLERAATELEALADRLEAEGVTNVLAGKRLAAAADDLAERAISAGIADRAGILDLLVRAADAGERMAAELAGVPYVSRVATGAARQVAAAMYAKGSPLAKLLDQLGPDTARILRDRIESGTLMGDNPREVARRAMADGAALSRQRAATIARTETLRAHRDATRGAYERAGIGEWVWLSAANGRTCATCWAMHGTRHPTTETLDGHPNCRCAMVPADTLAGDSIPAGADLFAQLPDADRRRIVGPRRHALLNEGRIRLADLADRRTSREWGSMRVPRPLAELEAIDRRPALGPDRPKVAPLTKAEKRAQLDAETAARAHAAGIPLDDYRRALAAVPEVRQAVRQEAKRAQRRVWKDLQRYHATVLRRPPPGRVEVSPDTGRRRVVRRSKATGTRAGGEWDWLDMLGPGEMRRLQSKRKGLHDGRGWFSDRGLSIDELDLSPLGITDPDEAAAWWVQRTREVDGLGAAAQGRMGATLGADELDDLLGAVRDGTGVRPSAVLAAGPDTHEAALAIARGWADQLADELAQREEYARRALADAMRPDALGPPPWRIARESWRAEVLELDDAIRGGYATDADRRRMDELLPYDLDDDLPLDELHARVIETARLAGMEVANDAAPW